MCQSRTRLFNGQSKSPHKKLFADSDYWQRAYARLVLTSATTIISRVLEGIFCRAGRELAPALVRAYQLGARLDAWKEHLDEDVWMKAFAETKYQPPTITFASEGLKRHSLGTHLSCGIPKSYFAKEWRRANRDSPLLTALRLAALFVALVTTTHQRTCSGQEKKPTLGTRSRLPPETARKLSPLCPGSTATKTSL